MYKSKIVFPSTHRGIYVFERVGKDKNNKPTIRAKCPKCGRVDWTPLLPNVRNGRSTQCFDCARGTIALPSIVQGILVFEKIDGKKVRAECPICKKTDWKITYSNILHGTITKCRDCYRTKIPGVYNGVEVLSVITMATKKTSTVVKCKCPRCNKTDWITNLHAVVSGSANMCLKCAQEYRGENARLPLPGIYNGIYVFERVGKINGNWRVRAECPTCKRTDWVSGISSICHIGVKQCKSCAQKQNNMYTVGTNEKKLLDLQEKIDNCIIDREVYILGYKPDGYCRETNTVYEVYEKYHDKQIQKDLNREEEICRELHCDFVIIYDRTH